MDSGSFIETDNLVSEVALRLLIIITAALYMIIYPFIYWLKTNKQTNKQTNIRQQQQKTTPVSGVLTSVSQK
jgi:UDP-N-acetylmuramyl pentapeptide phosphotransferase/UDP-N-acetylglucosamine-1-phosphate transferase